MAGVAEIKEQLVRARLKQARVEAQNKIVGYRPCCVVCHPGACRCAVASKHLSFHQSRARNRFVFGSNSGGKSWLGVTELVIHATFNVHPFNGLTLVHPANHRLMFESFRMLEIYYIPLLKQWIPRSMLVGGSWSDAWNVKFSVLRLRNGDQIDALSYDVEVDKFETVSLHSCWADEKIPEDIYDATLGRLLRTNGYFWNTVTPVNGMPWILRRIWGVNEADMQSWVIGMDENPYLTVEAKDRICAQWSPEEREARRTGKPMQFQGLVYPELEESVHMTDAKPESHWPLLFVMDAHPRKPAQMVWMAVGPGGALLAIDELAMKGTPKELAEAIFRKEYALRQWIGGMGGVPQGPDRIYKGVRKRFIDLSALTLDSDIQDHYDLLAEFRKAGLPFSIANRSSKGYSDVKTYLYTDKTKPIGLFNQPMLRFCRGRVPQTWFSMTHLIYDEFQRRGSRDVKEKVKDWGKDPADCVRYLCVEHPTFEMNAAVVAYGGQEVVGCYTR